MATQRVEVRRHGMPGTPGPSHLGTRETTNLMRKARPPHRRWLQIICPLCRTIIFRSFPSNRPGKLLVLADNPLSWRILQGEQPIQSFFLRSHPTPNTGCPILPQPHRGRVGEQIVQSTNQSCPAPIQQTFKSTSEFQSSGWPSRNSASTRCRQLASDGAQ